LKLIFSESEVAGYKATGQVTRERRWRPVGHPKAKTPLAKIMKLTERTEGSFRAFLERIDAPSLHDDDIAATLDHLNSVVAFRRAVGQPGATAKRGLSGKCYEKAFGDPVVSVYEGTIKVGEMTE
jgi:hypothetical protein